MYIYIFMYIYICIYIYVYIYINIYICMYIYIYIGRVKGNHQPAKIPCTHCLCLMAKTSKKVMDDKGSIPVNQSMKSP